MSPEATLLLLLPLYASPLHARAVLERLGWVSRDPSASADAQRSESARWRALWAPLWPMGLLAAVLTGWLVEELADLLLHEPAEPATALTFPAILVALPSTLILVRACWRALAGLLMAPPALPAVTYGLLRPTVAVAPAYFEQLQPLERAAVLAHEAAHVRHRDPLRLWLGRLASDLQWPSPRAEAGFDAWRNSLEVARDAEACSTGCEAAALARAVLVAARLGPASCRFSTAAGIRGSGAALRQRIESLLADSPPRSPERRRLASTLLGALAFAAASAVGFQWGEQVFRWLPGVSAGG